MPRIGTSGGVSGAETDRCEQSFTVARATRVRTSRDLVRGPETPNFIRTTSPKPTVPHRGARGRYRG